MRLPFACAHKVSTDQVQSLDRERDAQVFDQVVHRAEGVWDSIAVGRKEVFDLHGRFRLATTFEQRCCNYPVDFLGRQVWFQVEEDKALQGRGEGEWGRFKGEEDNCELFEGQEPLLRGSLSA